MREATDWIIRRSSPTADDVLAGATPHLELIGTVTCGALLAALAGTAAESGDADAKGLIDDARFFAGHRLGPARGLVAAVTAGAGVLPTFV